MRRFVIKRIPVRCHVHVIAYGGDISKLGPVGFLGGGSSIAFSLKAMSV